MKFSPAARRVLARLAYLMPVISALLLTAFAAIPHLYFFYNGAVQETVSLFSLVGNAWKNCRALLDGSANGSVSAFYFSVLITVAVIVFWVCVFLFCTGAVLSACFSQRAFAYPPTSAEANRAKQWFRFFCPNRVLFLLSWIFAVLPPIFPYILQLCYDRCLGMRVTVHDLFCPDLVLAVLLATLSVALFLFTLPIQSGERLDAFNRYKPTERNRTNAD